MTPAAEPRQQPFAPMSLDEARALARDRFKDRLQNGEQIGECGCHDEETTTAATGGPAERVVGVRFRDSGRTFYFTAGSAAPEVGDWVVVETSRGKEAGRVVIAPHQIALNMLDGELTAVERVLDETQIARMHELRGESSRAVKTFAAMIRERHLPMKAISANYNFDGSIVTLNYSTQERPNVRPLIPSLARAVSARVELNEVGPRDEARLLGGVGRCGRTLCCSSWLPVYPEISMGMAKTQDLALNPSKVSGVCGRLLCCLSYENEQYKQMKAVLPRLGQQIDTPAGRGMVISLQVIKEQVTVQLHDEPQEVVFTSQELGLASPEMIPASILSQKPAARLRPSPASDPAPPDQRPGNDGNRRRRRRRRNRGGGADAGGRSS